MLEIVRLYPRESMLTTLFSLISPRNCVLLAADPKPMWWRLHRFHCCLYCGSLVNCNLLLSLSVLLEDLSFCVVCVDVFPTFFILSGCSSVESAIFHLRKTSRVARSQVGRPLRESCVPSFSHGGKELVKQYRKREKTRQKDASCVWP